MIFKNFIKEKKIVDFKENLRYSWKNHKSVKELGKKEILHNILYFIGLSFSYAHLARSCTLFQTLLLKELPTPGSRIYLYFQKNIQINKCRIGRGGGIACILPSKLRPILSRNKRILNYCDFLFRNKIKLNFELPYKN